jgi:hypothetical protein
VMENPHVKNCRSQTGCRCYWHPETLIEMHRD